MTLSEFLSDRPLIRGALALSARATGGQHVERTLDPGCNGQDACQSDKQTPSPCQSAQRPCEQAEAEPRQRTHSTGHRMVQRLVVRCADVSSQFCPTVTCFCGALESPGHPRGTLCIPGVTTDCHIVCVAGSVAELFVPPVRALDRSLDIFSLTVVQQRQRAVQYSADVGACS